MWKLTRRRTRVTRVAAIPEFDLPLITALICDLSDYVAGSVRIKWRVKRPRRGPHGRARWHPG